MAKTAVFFCEGCEAIFTGPEGIECCPECLSTDIWRHTCEKCSELADHLIEIRDQEPAPRVGTEYHMEARCGRH